jgi:hypothetical protein
MTAISMRGRNKVKELLNLLRGFIKEISKMISSMEGESSFTKIEKNFKEIS